MEKLNKKYTDLLAEVLQAQRSGDIEGYSRLSTEADGVLKQMEKLDSSKG